MLKKLFLITLLSSALASWAQKPIELPVWPNGAPEDNGITTPESGSSNRPGNISEAKLYVYPAQRPNGMAIICCPGGGYAHLAMDHEGRNMADWFNAQGITFAVLKYRMPNGHKNVPLSDAKEAMKIVKAHAEEWKVEPHCIGIMGSSAGGHLAASLANLAEDENRPAFQILLYPVINMQPNLTHRGSHDRLLGKDASEAEVAEFSMHKRVSDKTPQAFITLSGDDRAVPPVTNGLAYAQALLRAKVPVSLHMYPVGGHGWGFRDGFAYKRQWTGELEKWLRDIKK